MYGLLSAAIRHARQIVPLAEKTLRLVRLRQASEGPAISLATLPNEIFDVIIEHVQDWHTSIPRIEAPLAEGCTCLDSLTVWDSPSMQNAFQGWLQLQSSALTISSEEMRALFELSRGYQTTLRSAQIIAFRDCVPCRRRFDTAWSTVRQDKLSSNNDPVSSSDRGMACYMVLRLP